MADVSVRPARPDDAERVAAVQLGTWRAAYGDLLPAELLATGEGEAAAAWRAAVASPPSPRHRLLVALDGTDVVGLAASEPLGSDTAELSALLVEPAAGRRGHGSRLLAASVDHWREDGVGVAVAWVWEADTVTRDFLGSSGWAPDGAVRALDSGQRQLRLHTSVPGA